MRILVLTDLYPPHVLGGAELSCQGHSEALRARGHEVVVLTSRWSVELPIVEDGVHRLLHYDTTGLADGKPKLPRSALRLRRRYDQVRRAASLERNYGLARRVALAVRPDVAYVWHLGRVSIAPLLAVQDAGIPAVIRLPDYWLAQLRTEICQEPNRLKRWYRGLVSGMGGFSRLDTHCMLANGRALMQEYVQAGFPAAGLRVIPQGIPSSQMLDEGTLPAGRVCGAGGEVALLCAGRLVEAKGIDTAIRALACLANDPGAPPARLDIAGEGEPGYVDGLRALAADLGQAGRVRFLGKLEHAQLVERYATYDAYLFPSRWVEPFGRGVIEAMARGVPVIATDRGGPAEIITNGEDGLLVPIGDPAAMAAAAKRIVTEPELAQRIRRNALATVRARYCSERLIEQVEECLRAAAQPAG